ncbi:MAG TPA: hypothetical protein PKL31_08590 [Fulvivirga sp.]|nr:hypothetical protein [Fulvivirga sp.]
MRKAGYIGIFIFLTVMGVISCVDDNIQPEEAEPYISVKFINNRSLDTLNVLLAAIKADIAVITKRITAIDAMTDKTPFLAEKDSLNKVKASLTTEQTEVNNKINKLKKGYVKLTTLQSLGGSSPITKLDSTGTNEFPLNSNATKSRFFTTIRLSDDNLESRLDTIEFEYTLDTLFVENTIRISAQWPKVTYYSFDSVSNISCKDSITCTSNDASLTIYY